MSRETDDDLFLSKNCGKNFSFSLFFFVPCLMSHFSSGLKSLQGVVRGVSYVRKQRVFFTSVIERVFVSLPVAMYMYIYNFSLILVSHSSQKIPF